MPSKIHLIAIGGSVMHNMALALVRQGHHVTGSDDQIFEPAKSRLNRVGILPDKEGWDESKINSDLDVVILGMHAKIDNPELIRALELEIPVYSFPAYVSEMFHGKLKVVVAGSHGKTTTTSMIMHVLKSLNLSFDFLVGAQLEGFDEMVAFSDAPLAIIEGDEYLSSCLDLRPKFLHYAPQILIITGIAWDHYNVFPTLESYIKSFSDLIQTMPEGGALIYFQGDPELVSIVKMYGGHLRTFPYGEANHINKNGTTFLVSETACYPLEIFGRHNLQNIEAVRLVCNLLEQNDDRVFASMSSFKGAKRRLELLAQSGSKIIYQDFAHAPSKVKATVEAVREKYPDKRILVIQELHTYSSLNEIFLPQYKGTANAADAVLIYFDQRALQIKRMPPLSSQIIKDAFSHPQLFVVDSSDQLEVDILKLSKDYEVILFLGSGNFGGLSLKDISQKIISAV
ncbi:MAG: peptidoglycan synthetase [Saprospiraceae bacterium]|nr:peptidoglycan synthetase [Candidatus Defluviibacterium haderslevense]